MIQGDIRFFRGTKQMQHTSHQEYSDSELEWSNLVLKFCLILPKTYVKGCLTVKFPAKNTGAYDTHAPIFYTYSVSNICSDEVNYYFPAKRLRKYGAQNTHALILKKKLFCWYHLHRQ